MTRPIPPAWLSPPEVGALLHIKADKVITLIRSGRLPALNVASLGSKRPRFRVRLEDVERALAYHPEPNNGRRTRRGRKPQGVIQYF